MATVTLVSDSFNRADGAVGVADSGMQSRASRGTKAPQPTPDETPESPAFTTAELERCRTALGVVPATIKAAVELGYVWLKELYTPGDPYAFAIAWDNVAGEYVGLKLETRTWRVVAEKSL